MEIFNLLAIVGSALFLVSTLGAIMGHLEDRNQNSQFSHTSHAENSAEGVNYRIILPIATLLGTAAVYAIGMLVTHS